MAFPKERWRITKVAGSAKRRFDKLDSEIKGTLLDGMERLTLDPHEGDVRKIQGKDDLFRLGIEDNKAGIRDKTIQRL